MTAKHWPSPLTHFCFFVFILTACVSNRSIPNEEDRFDPLVNGKIEQPYTTHYNAARTHALLVEKRTSDHAEKSMTYLVVEVSAVKIVHEGTFKLGGVVWKNDSAVEVTSFSSVTDEVGTKKIINITNLQ